MIKRYFDTFIDAIGYVIIKASPVIAAFPAAITILEAAGYTLEAWIKVGGVEFMGYAIGHAAVDMVRRKWLTLRQVAIGIGVYCLVIEGMLLGYDVAPAWNSWLNGQGSFAEAAQSTVSLLLPAFTLAGAALYAYWQYKEERTAAEKEDHDRDRAINDQRAAIDLDMYRREREQELELKREREETRNRIKEQQASVKQSVKSTVRSPLLPVVEGQDFTPDFTPVNADERRETLHNILQTEFDGQPAAALNKSALARRLVVSRPTLNADIDALIAGGKLELNGHVKVK